MHCQTCNCKIDAFFEGEEICLTCWDQRQSEMEIESRRWTVRLWLRRNAEAHLENTALFSGARL